MSNNKNPKNSKRGSWGGYDGWQSNPADYLFCPTPIGG